MAECVLKINSEYNIKDVSQNHKKSHIAIQFTTENVEIHSLNVINIINRMRVD
jgi:hypothetical protein